MLRNSRATFFFLVTLVLLGLACGPGLNPTATAPAVPADLELAPGMEIGLVSTTLGGLAARDEVAETTPGGGMLVTVQEVTAGQSVTVFWQRTVERELSADGPTPVVGVGTPEPTAVMEEIIQEGMVAGAGLDDAHIPLLPIYWPQVDAPPADTSLMWLSADAFAELKETRQTRWSADVLTRISNLPRQALAQIDEEIGDRDIFLSAEGEFADYDLRVNGRETTVQAIRAHDDFGNGYTILDDAANPLILKFTFNAVSTGVIGIDAGLWTLIKALFSGYEVVEIRTP